jgi:hypothetical protein
MERDDLTYDPDVAYVSDWERSTLLYEQNKAYLDSLRQDQQKKIPKTDPVQHVPTPPKPDLDPDVKLTVEQLRARRVAHFQKLHSFSL